MKLSSTLIWAAAAATICSESTESSKSSATGSVTELASASTPSNTRKPPSSTPSSSSSSSSSSAEAPPDASPDTSPDAAATPSSFYSKASYDPPKCAKDILVLNSADLLAVSDCETISGDLVVKAFDSDYLDLGSITRVKGNLKIANCSEVARIDALALDVVEGAFELDTLTSLTSASFPKLSAVDTMDWHILPILSSVSMDTGIQSINSVILSDTSLTGFGGFDVDTLKTFKVDNNRFLETIESSVKEVSGSLVIAANADTLRISLPELKKVKSVTIKDAEDLEMKSLQAVEDSAQFIENRIGSLELPKLKTIGKTLSIIDNSMLSSIDFQGLTEVGGGVMIIDNDKIHSIDFFPVLKSIGGAIEFQGNIDSTEFPKLRILKGSAMMKSTSAKLVCSDWVDEISKVVRGGKIECGSNGSQATEVVHVDDKGAKTRTKGSGKDGSILPSSGALSMKQLAPGIVLVVTTVLFFSMAN